MKSTTALLFASTLLLASPAFAAAPNVVVSIKPVHSLVASIMQGIGEPSLIVEGGASPHTYTMKPSNAAALQAAKVVFWSDPASRRSSTSRLIRSAQEPRWSNSARLPGSRS